MTTNAPRRSGGIALLATLVAGLALVLAGCGGASSSGASGIDGSAPHAQGLQGFTGTSAGGAESARSAKDTVANDPAVIQRKVVSTGSLEVTSHHVSGARAEAESIATGFGGYVADEDSTTGARGAVRSADLTLRVPAARFDTAMDRLAGIGHLRHRDQSSKDVTTAVIDIAAQVRAKRAGVASLERLYRQATTIGQVIEIEGQLTKRQAALDSLEQQQKYLADQTAMSTITLTVDQAVRHHQPVAHRTGFVGAFHAGWTGLGAVGAALLVALGAVLPFALVIAVIGVPTALVVRRRLRRRPAQPAA